MAETVTAVGIDVEQIVTDALLEAQGSQKAYYITQLIAALGSNPKVRLKREGSTVYEATLSAAISNSGGSLAVPAAWNSPSTNSAADIDTGAWLFEIEKATDSGVRLSMSAGPNGADVVAKLSEDLDGTRVVSPLVMLFSVPDNLDTNVSGADPILTVQTLIDDMGQDNDDSAYGFPQWWARPDSRPAGLTPGFVAWGTNWDSSVQADWFKNQPNIGGALQTRYWRYFLPWWLAYTGDNHAGLNLAMKMKKFRVLARRRDNGTWVVVRFNNNGAGQTIKRARLGDAISSSETIEKVEQSDHVLVRHLNIFETSEVPANEAHNPHGYWGGAQFMDESVYDIIIHAFLGNLEKWDPNGPDDRDGSSIVMAMGGDPYPYVGYNPGATGNLPAFAHSRLKRMTSARQWFTCSTLLNCRQDHNGPTAAATVASLTANPPPVEMLRDNL